MTNCLFYTVIFILFISTSTGSLKYSQVHRSFLSIYKGMLEASTFTVDSKGEPIVPYYDREKIETNVSEYLEHKLDKYIKNYTLTINFLDKETHKPTLNECRYLEISLDAKINFLYHYKHTQCFSIMSRYEI